jgi:hypothetical protein
MINAGTQGNGSIYDRINAGEWKPETYGVVYPTTYGKKDAAYMAQREAYRAKGSELLASFRAVLCAEYGVSGALADLIWEKAWQDGHSEGLHRVYQEFDEVYVFAMAIVASIAK